MAERSEEVQRRIQKDRNLAFLHEIYSCNVDAALQLLDNDELIEPDFTTSDGESGLHLACRNQLLRLVKELILQGWNYGLHCTYKNTRPYSELNPFDEESSIVQRQREETNQPDARSMYIINDNGGSKTNDANYENKINDGDFGHKVQEQHASSPTQTSPISSPSSYNILQEVFRIYEGPIPYVILVFSTSSPAFVVGDTIGAPTDKRRQIYNKTTNTMNGVTFIRCDNDIDDNNFQIVEFVCTVKTKYTLKFKCAHYSGTYRFIYTNNKKVNDSEVHLIQGKRDNLNMVKNLRMKIVTATTITVEWDEINDNEIVPHSYYVTLKTANGSGGNKDSRLGRSKNISVTQTILYPNLDVTFENLLPDTTYTCSVSAERHGQYTPESSVRIKTAIAPIRPATIYENRLLYFSCEDGDMEDIKERLETARHEVAYDRHFVHDVKTGETAIHGAAKFGRGHICKYLLLKGWKLQRFPPIVEEDDKGVIDEKDENKKSPKKSLEQRLIARVKGVKGRNAVFNENVELWFLAEKGDLEAIKYMLTDEKNNVIYDRKFCYQVSKGETALHIAAKNGHKELARFLISKKWDPEERNYKKQSPGGLAHQFLTNVRNGRKQREKNAEIKMQMFLSHRASSMAEKARKAFDWINKHGDGSLGGKYVLTEMKKLHMSNNPTWSMKEKKMDLMRREKRDRNRVSLGIKVLDRLKALEAYPVRTLEHYQTLTTRVQDAGNGTYVTWPMRLLVQYERTLNAYEQRKKMKQIKNKVQHDGRCWRCQSVLYPVDGFEVVEPRCSFCWGVDGGFYDAFLREGRL